MASAASCATAKSPGPHTTACDPARSTKLCASVHAGTPTRGRAAPCRRAPPLQHLEDGAAAGRLERLDARLDELDRRRRARRPPPADARLDLRRAGPPGTTRTSTRRRARSGMTWSSPPPSNRSVPGTFAPEQRMLRPDEVLSCTARINRAAFSIALSPRSGNEPCGDTPAPRSSHRRTRPPRRRLQSARLAGDHEARPQSLGHHDRSSPEQLLVHAYPERNRHRCRGRRHLAGEHATPEERDDGALAIAGAEATQHVARRRQRPRTRSASRCRCAP